VSRASDDGRDGRKTVATNRKARHEYEILDSFEAGLMLQGPEVKSIRDGKVSISEAFARVDNGEAWLYGMHISPYEPASRWNPPERRPRKLLLNRKEIRELAAATDEKGRTLVPLELYFRRGRAKLAIGIARGKKLHDKRQDLKQREADREMQRAFREARR